MSDISTGHAAVSRESATQSGSRAPCLKVRQHPSAPKELNLRSA